MSYRQPPVFFHWFFKRICRKDLYEELEGDLFEGYVENAEEKGLSKARWIYRKEVLKMIRPSVLKKVKINSKYNHLIMFRNYFKTSIRSLMKNPLSSLINLVGLSVAIGICIFAYAFVQWTYSTDQFHENKENVFLVTTFADREGTEQQFGKTPRPLANHLKDNITGIVETCRIDSRNVVVKNGENVFHEKILLVDPSYLNLFTFPLKGKGNDVPLEDASNIVISEEMSTKYFGDESPLGKSLLVKFGQGRNKTYQVSGVAEEFPDAKSFDFHFLISYENFKTMEPGYDQSDWTKQLDATMIQVTDPSDISDVKAQSGHYAQIYNDAQSNWEISSFGFEPLSTIHYKSEYIRDDIFYSVHDNYNSIVFLVTLSVFLILLACFNYINIAIVSAAKRLKEISLRKVIGASRSMVMMQFLSENIFLTSIAAIMGLLVGVYVFIPWFENMFSFNMSFSYTQPELYFFLLVIVVFAGLTSGLYPSFYVAKFQAVSIMKGSLRFGKKNLLTKVLLGFQLVLSCLLITVGVVFTLNHEYMSQRSWGYDQKHTLYSRVIDDSGFEQLRSKMAQDPNVLSISGSVHHLGRKVESLVVDRPDREYEIHYLAVGPEYFKTMSIDLKHGELLGEEYSTESHKIVVNETLITKLGLERPIGEVLKIGDTRYEVIGVVEDFHEKSFYHTIRPTAFLLADKSDFQYISIQARPEREIDVFLALRGHWMDLFPEEPFQGGYQEDVWGYYFNELGNHGKFWRGISFVTALLAALGLYGLVTLNVTGRIREFCIRKTLGARLENILKNMIKPYLWLFAIALSIGGPISFLVAQFLMDFAYNYHVQVDFSVALIAILILVTILFLVTAVQINRLSKANPVEGLRTE